MPNSPAQEMAIEKIAYDIKIHKCQFVANPYAPVEAKSADSEDSDEDFEEEQSKPTKKRLKIPPIAQLGCSMVDKANQLLNELKEPIDE